MSRRAQWGRGIGHLPTGGGSTGVGNGVSVTNPAILFFRLLGFLRVGGSFNGSFNFAPAGSMTVGGGFAGAFNFGPVGSVVVT